MQHNILEQLNQAAAEILKDLYNLEQAPIDWQPTRKEFDGDLTLVVFPYLRASKKKPEATAEEIGIAIQERLAEVQSFNVIKGFLNISIADTYWAACLHGIQDLEDYGYQPQGKETVLVEYSSPNTNKPLHLGHIRNNLLGYSVAEILKAAGKDIKKVQIINDRGIHICKSMVAWQKFAGGETPDSANLKGDHLVGKYYVEFETRNNKEVNFLLEIYKALFPFDPNEDYNSGSIKLARNAGLVKQYELLLTEGAGSVNWTDIYSGSFPSREILKDLIDGLTIDQSLLYQSTADYHNLFKIHADKGDADLNIEDALKAVFKNSTQLLSEAQLMLFLWEQGDADTVALWEKMNQWVYDGFETTYQRLGVDFDKNYYESNTYLLGKEVVEEGLAKGVFFRKEDGSVWCDLEEEKLGEKLLLRKDGTSVYMTQDIGTAIQRYEDFGLDGMIYTVGNEQDHHFKVLFAILNKLGYTWAEQLYHLSYGMVDLPSGKMKSREGTVVDADDLIDQMEATAREISEELGKTDGIAEEDKQGLYHMIGMGALKYFILKVDPRKRMLFNPEESIDFQGNTGPFIQYTHARIQSLLRKAEEMGLDHSGTYNQLHEHERTLIQSILKFPEVVQEAASDKAPSVIANYTYDLVKSYNSMYQQLSILNDEDRAAVAFRVDLSKKTATVIKNAMRLLGIGVPDRM